jgi:23S rRNA (adenine2503-C2)-methyltransferase
MQEFTARLAARGVPVTVRDTRGSQIDGACGQLAGPAAAAGRRSRPALPVISQVP